LVTLPTLNLSINIPIQWIKQRGRFGQSDAISTHPETRLGFGDRAHSVITCAVRCFLIARSHPLFAWAVRQLCSYTLAIGANAVVSPTLSDAPSTAAQFKGLASY
jgi:hypothetical protein